jgi:hypothetical protein
VGQAFNSTVEGLSSDAEAKKLAAAILLRRFFDKGTEQGAARTPYEHEAVAVIAALLRNTPTGELQKLLADGHLCVKPAGGRPAGVQSEPRLLGLATAVRRCEREREIARRRAMGPS